MQDFKQLRVWQQAHELTLQIYKETKSFPADEAFGLTSQLRRSCQSIPTNIAEGAGRESNKEFKRFLYIAMGSASETEYQLILSRDLGYLSQEVYTSLEENLLSVKRMLYTFIQRLTDE